MGHIDIQGISSKIKSKLGSVKDVPMRSIEKYSDSNMTIVNEDNIQEYIEASSRGQGDEYMEYLEEDGSVDQQTVEAAKDIDVSNSITEKEVKRKIDREINNIYTKGNLEEVVKKLQKDINKAIRENNLEDRIPSGVVNSMDKLTDIMKKVVRYAETAVFFLGVGGSMLISKLGMFTMGAGMIMALFTPIFIGASIYDGTPLLGLKLTALIAAYIVGGAAANAGFDSLAKILDEIYTKRRGIN